MTSSPIRYGLVFFFLITKLCDLVTQVMFSFTEKSRPYEEYHRVGRSDEGPTSRKCGLVSKIPVVSCHWYSERKCGVTGVCRCTGVD